MYDCFTRDRFTHQSLHQSVQEDLMELQKRLDGMTVCNTLIIRKTKVEKQAHRYSSRGVVGSGLTASKSSLNAFEEDSLGRSFEV